MTTARAESRAGKDDALRVRIGEIDVAVRSDLPGVLDDFAELYRGCPRETPETGGNDRVIRMHVRAGRRGPLGRRRYDICGDDDVIMKDCRADEVLPHLEWGINWRVIATRPEFLLLHAASLVRDGKGVILAGISGSGKSTLAAGLLARGWDYLCDEFALIDRETHRLHAFPKAVCVKAGAFDVIRRLRLPLVGDRHYVKAMKGRVGYVNPVLAGSPAVTEPAPIRLVLFPRYDGTEAPLVKPISRAKAVFALATHAIVENGQDAREMPILGRIVREARCAWLESGEIEATCDLVETLIA